MYLKIQCKLDFLLSVKQRDSAKSHDLFVNSNYYHLQGNSIRL